MKLKNYSLIAILIAALSLMAPDAFARHGHHKHGHAHNAHHRHGHRVANKHHHEQDTISPRLTQMLEDAEEHGEPIIRVKLGRSIQRYPLEAYLAGVIGNEMSRRWPDEALKAQAVAARSYALYRMGTAKAEGRPWDVLPTQADQMFRPQDIFDPHLQHVVASTRGETLMSGGHAIEAFYSSTCGGKTRGAVEAGLTDDSPITKSCTDGFCKASPFRDWVLRYSYADLKKRLSRAHLGHGDVNDVKVSKVAASGYVEDVQFSTGKKKWTLSAIDFRHLLGSMQLKSLYFTLHDKGNGIEIDGKGFGHGVGLCQYGAKGMALDHIGYKKILAKYYPNIKLANIYHSEMATKESKHGKSKHIAKISKRDLEVAATSQDTEAD